ncbi:MAG: hypothetical protein GFH23_1086718n18 [Chloroflexi bacterium AL-N1]|nr:hypothetical protein [Chloroflexi bacterium AL-N1]NOK77327.1 hypothetical protein [Chloroflexi bacterium AL-N5]
MEREYARDTVALIAYLHSQLLKIVPSVSYEAQSDQILLRSVRMPIEVSAARRIILSHIEQFVPLNPEQEAVHLFNLLHTNVMFTSSGIYPPVEPYTDIMAHNIAVAVHLRRLESHNTKP